MELSAFYQTFFDEAAELLADMEQHLLVLDPQSPDSEQLNAIFRAAHSIKGGAGTFGFTVLQETTHLLENLLDEARRGEMSLSTAIVNLFLETKDIMQDQLDAYKTAQEPDAASFAYICEALRQLALEAKGGVAPDAAGHPAPQAGDSLSPAKSAKLAATDAALSIRLSGLKPGEIPLMLEELGNLGTVLEHHESSDGLSASLQTTVSEDDICAVLCFVLDADQIHFDAAPVADTVAAAPAPGGDAAASVAATAAANLAPANDTLADNVTPINAAPARQAEVGTARVKPADTSIRVAVEKVDQLINLVGELVITQSMIAQRSGALDPVEHSDLLISMGQLERNARDLQESVMSIRMMPMEYVFNRFPRLVRDLAARLDKQVQLTLEGSSTELDKSLIERIIDPLTHLVRNSLDHGIESPDIRIALGKPAVGNLQLRAEHQGGNICIEVSDDGAGLNRERILAKALSQGLPVNDSMTDEEVGMLIFAPGFSTAEQVTDVSGRGVGMDVVKRNIQAMGGHVDILSQAGKGTTIRILLPLTLAILDGMSVRVNQDVFILPLNTVMESLQPQADDLHPLAGGEQVLQVRGEYLPLVELHHLFDVSGAKTDPTQGIVVILQSAGRRYALLVDQLIGQHQVVVKNLESNYRKVPGISAATILGDGSVALIIDVSALQALNRVKRLAGAA
ncbi:chemotaxis protein CheA [Acerihabitans arboris]|uniref:Chemotaxis protein CheA n=1 Tax=Acerihabitans arboris TaxID=2691583 RepID=A0A845SH44_9GAMM|nr:chemotaxis protein CheA [Acerihabitans arboris]NDL62637.1 chemotaxis protein CheA [Acerihabitans arboris]